MADGSAWRSRPTRTRKSPSARRPAPHPDNSKKRLTRHHNGSLGTSRCIQRSIIIQVASALAPSLDNSKKRQRQRQRQRSRDPRRSGRARRRRQAPVGRATVGRAPLGLSLSSRLSILAERLRPLAFGLPRSALPKRPGCSPLPRARTWRLPPRRSGCRWRSRQNRHLSATPPTAPTGVDGVADRVPDRSVA